MGNNAQALANAAREGGKLFQANIPTQLINRLKEIGIATVKVTEMGEKVSKKIRFDPKAMEYILKYFKEVAKK